MELRRVVSLREETRDVLNSYADVFEIHSVKTIGTLRHMLEESTFAEKQETLLIATTEETLHLGKEYDVATLGYSKPNKQTSSPSGGNFFGGVEYVLESFEGVEASFLEKVHQRYHKIPWIIAETKRCIIRELCMEDVDALFALYEDKELTKYTESLLEYEEELNKQRAYIDHMYRYFGYGMWLVFLKDTGELIGRAGVEHHQVPESGDLESIVELGYLIKRKYQGQGLAKEVCQTILKYVEEELEIEELNCFIEEGNTPSIKIAESLGFSYIGAVVEQDRKLLRFIRK